MPRKRGILRISHELLIERLGLPAEVEVLGASSSFYVDGSIDIKVSHPAIPDVREGHDLPIVIVEGSEEWLILKSEETEDFSDDGRYDIGCV